MSSVSDVIRWMKRVSNASFAAIDGTVTWFAYAASRSMGNVSRTYSKAIVWLASSHICLAR